MQGVDTLSGAIVMATDLRASASLVIAGLVARRDGGRPHLPPGSRLRPHGSQAARHRRGHRARSNEHHDHLALSKGRIFDETLPLLKAAGIGGRGSGEESRKLIGTNRSDVRVVLVRATDVPTYVQYGGADLGVVGRDTCSSMAAGPVPAAGPEDRRAA